MGDRSFGVFPVRTPLSRFLLDNANCCVWIRTPISHKYHGEVSAEERRLLAERIDQLMLPKRITIAFQISVNNGSEQASRAFAEKTAKDLAEQLGFKNSSVRVETLPD